MPKRASCWHVYYGDIRAGTIAREGEDDFFSISGGGQTAQRALLRCPVVIGSTRCRMANIWADAASRCSCVAIKLYSMGWRAVGNRNNSGMANRARSATRENVAIPAPLRRTAPRAISLLHRIRWNPLKPHVCGAERSPRRAQIAAEASRIRDASDRPARLSSLQC